MMDDDEMEIEHAESDMDFLRERAKMSVHAVDVRGWDPEKKEAFLLEVKEHAQVESGQDLEDFARGVLLRDENVRDVEVDEYHVKMSYRMPAKFLGFLSSNLNAHVSLENEGTSTSTEAQARVKVRFPWYRFLFSVPEEVGKDNLQLSLESKFYAEGDMVPVEDFALNFEKIQAQYLEEMSAVMKVAHEAAMNAIRNLK